MFFRILGAVLMMIGGLLFISETPDTASALYQLAISITGAIVGFIGWWLYDRSGGTFFKSEEEYRYHPRW